MSPLNDWRASSTLSAPPKYHPKRIGEGPENLGRASTLVLFNHCLTIHCPKARAGTRKNQHPGRLGFRFATTAGPFLFPPPLSPSSATSEDLGSWTVACHTRHLELDFPSCPSQRRRSTLGRCSWLLAASSDGLTQRQPPLRSRPGPSCDGQTLRRANVVPQLANCQ